jgi:hypothetical protein
MEGFPSRIFHSGTGKDTGNRADGSLRSAPEKCSSDSLDKGLRNLNRIFGLTLIPSAVIVPDTKSQKICSILI